MIKLYIAAKYSKKQECRILANALIARGIGVTSRWHDLDSEEDQVTDTVLKRHYAERDLEDIRRANGLVMLNHGEPSVGRHIEVGYALGIGKPVIVIGRTESVFHYAKEVRLGNQLGDVLAWARSLKGEY